MWKVYLKISKVEVRFRNRTKSCAKTLIFEIFSRIMNSLARRNWKLIDSEIFYDFCNCRWPKNKKKNEFNNSNDLIIEHFANHEWFTISSRSNDWPTTASNHIFHFNLLQTLRFFDFTQSKAVLAFRKFPITFATKIIKV